MCVEAGARCLVDDRADIALAIGVHDLPPDAARRLVRPDHVLGSTAREPATARELVAQGATNLGAGPSFSMPTRAGLPITSPDPGPSS